MDILGQILLSVDEEDLEFLSKDPEKFWDGFNCIGPLAFAYSKGLKEITIPDSILSIGVAAFGECANLKKITFANITNFKDNLNVILDGFSFDSFEQNGNEVTFVRNIENKNDDEKE